MWGFLKDRVYINKPADLQELKAAIRREMRRVTVDKVDRTIQHLKEVPSAAHPTATRSPSGASSLELRRHACEITVECQCNTCFALVLPIHFHHSHNRTTNTFDTAEENLGNILYGSPWAAPPGGKQGTCPPRFKIPGGCPPPDIAVFKENFRNIC